MKLPWDYTDRAHTYDKRPDYSHSAVSELIATMSCPKGAVVADIGAGTGKLTKLLTAQGLYVEAIEPNDTMRAYGNKNTQGTTAYWSKGKGESTGLKSSSIYAAFFGSSFNVVDRESTLNEVARILMPNGWFACMWNHRDMDDPLQKVIEEIIHLYLPNYEYGSRRDNPTPVINNSGHFSRVMSIEKAFVVEMFTPDIVAAWESHATLYRQSGGRFSEIINAISEELTKESYLVPYHTKIWFANFMEE